MKGDFYDTLTQAVKEFVTRGFQSQTQLDEWMKKIHEAAQATLTPPHKMDEMLRESLRAVYDRLVAKGGLLKTHPGVSRFTLERVAPRLRAELDRRIMASAQLIKLNRASAIEKTLQRFAGWASSVPVGGSKSTEKVDVKTSVRKPLASLPFEERRVLIDQGHKLASGLNEVLAVDGGAIAAIWHSHFRQPGYNYREDHKERDGRVYLIRGNWAQEKGLVKPGPDGYTDEIDKAGEKIYCRCWFTYLYNLRDLPEYMLTVKGKEALAKVRVA